jgi:hypothetical protein
MKRCRFSSPVLCLALAGVSVQLFGRDLSSLDKGRNVRLVMVGEGPLCQGKIVSSSRAAATVRLSEAAPDCGEKDQLIYLSGDNVVDLVPEHHATRGRILSKVLAGCAGVAVLAAVPLTSSDPESLLILANVVLPAAAFYAGWRIVPKRLDYLVIMNCPDRRHCVSSSQASARLGRR